MTLKEKIDNALFYIEPKVSIKDIEFIADDHAIEFAEWYLKVSEKYDSHLKLKEDTKELLEIYKQEKGL
jgi:hypothetical protein